MKAFAAFYDDMTASSKQHGCMQDLLQFMMLRQHAVSSMGDFYDVVMAGKQIRVHKQVMETKAVCHVCFVGWFIG